MAAAGASVEVILAAVEAEVRAEGEQVQARRAKDAERQRQWRARHSTSRPVTVSHSDINDSLTSLLSSSVKKEEIKEVSKKVRFTKSLLPGDWQPKLSHFATAKRLGQSDEYVHMKADDLRDWANSKAVMRADWDATFNGFLRRDVQKGAHDGKARKQSLSELAFDLADEARERERAAGIIR